MLPPSRAAASQRAGGHAYVIQKHDATRLHYDLRLELDGVMKSWAVTRGPSLDPNDKRLAVHVEDHPVAYNSFEGTIPEGEYGGGTVMIWDRGTWTPEGDAHKGYAKGHLEFTLNGEKLHGRWHLVRMRPRPGDRRDQGHDNWLLIKAKDEEAKSGRGTDILEAEPKSAVSGRSMEEIAAGKGKKRVWHSNRPAGGAGKDPQRDSPDAVRRAAIAARVQSTIEGARCRAGEARRQIRRAHEASAEGRGKIARPHQAGHGQSRAQKRAGVG